jgi:hypothetical protein
MIKIKQKFALVSSFLILFLTTSCAEKHNSKQVNIDDLNSDLDVFLNEKIGDSIKFRNYPPIMYFGKAYSHAEYIDVHLDSVFANRKFLKECLNQTNFSDEKLLLIECYTFIGHPFKMGSITVHLINQNTNRNILFTKKNDEIEIEKSDIIEVGFDFPPSHIDFNMFDPNFLTIYSYLIFNKETCVYENEVFRVYFG